MLISYDNYNGTPYRLYRSPSEIKGDICTISEKIKRTNERMNVRHMLLELLTGDEERKPEETVLLLEEIVAQAQDSLLELKCLNESLLDLECELKETGGLIN